MKDFPDAIALKYKNFVLLGEAGSGKSELGVNLAMELACDGRSTHFFDLDQTKPLFRARDVSEEMRSAGVVVHVQPQFQDIPSMVPGVIESLQDPDRTTVLDIGGGVHGALMAGQLSQFINTPNTCVFYIINVFRPWSGSAQSIAQTREEILEACRVMRVCLIANPNLGPTTTAEEVLYGDRRLDELLNGEARAEYICVADNLLSAVREKTDKCIIPLHPRIRMMDQICG